MKDESVEISTTTKRFKETFITRRSTEWLYSITPSFIKKLNTRPLNNEPSPLLRVLIDISLEAKLIRDQNVSSPALLLGPKFLNK